MLIGSSLHIYCGAAEIRRVTRPRGAMEIELTDAGAREGDLFLYSRWPPFLKSAAGCTVDGVEGAGENVWRVAGRRTGRPGAPQRMELGVLLPFTRQTWFWLLLAAAAGSLLFSAWRYVVGLRLQRERALAQERTRIAGDIHDEVGANLTQISVLGSLAARPTTDADTARRYSLEMAGVARETTRALEEIVWSINPKSDSVRSVAEFVSRRAEELLEPGNVRCQVVLDEALPDRPMAPRRRHGLLLAFKEALNNVLKHAQATQVEVRCVMDGSVFEVRVTDNGRGFDPASASAGAGRQGNGLGNMRRRMADLGGECRIESRAGEGTVVGSGCRWTRVWEGEVFSVQYSVFSILEQSMRLGFRFQGGDSCTCVGSAS